MKKLPLGIQSFKEIRSKDLLYVDKTEHLFNLAMGEKYHFLSRPRRFGKSLTVNTLAAIFRGEKHLFEGLWIEDRWDWQTKYPVIQIGFSSIGYKSLGLPQAIINRLKEQGRLYGIQLEERGMDVEFRELILELFAAHGPVVILIDEYDKPIIDYLEDPDRANEQRDLLKTFYSVLKDLDDCLRFVLITGVSKFSRASIFSELNNLTDLSLAEDFATALGYTQAELEYYFEEAIGRLAAKHGWTQEGALREIREWYNGYSWNGVDRVYNPFSILSLFRGMQFMNFWFETGTPTFLIKLLKKHRAYDLDGIESSDAAFGSYDLANISYLTLLFQTGYVTIQKALGMRLYRLGYPNKEVRESMLQYLIGEYRGSTPDIAPVPALKMAHALVAGDLEGMIVQLNALLASIPYEWHQQLEAYYHTIVHLALSLIGVHIQSEIHTSKGRLDSVIHTDKAIYILEFKADKSADAALTQVRKKGYAEPYLGKGKPVVAVGINFSTEKREVSDWKFEEAE